jgi:hypothetical protein
MAKRRHDNCALNGCRICLEDHEALGKEIEEAIGEDCSRRDVLGEYHGWSKRAGVEPEDEWGWGSKEQFDERYIAAYVSTWSEPNLLAQAMEESTWARTLMRRALEAECDAPGKSEPQEVLIIFDGPPGPESGRFVETETPEGNSCKAGGWKQLPGGLWSLGPFMTIEEETD